MPSEEQVRAGMHRLAKSLEVDTEHHLAAVLAETRGRGQAGNSARSRLVRSLVPVAAAAAVVGVLAATAALTGVFPNSDSDLDVGGPVVVAGTPEGTVPSVFGHTVESVSTLFVDRGLRIRYGQQTSCDPSGRPVGTEPSTGTPVRRGQTITVLLSYQGPTTDCAADLREPWRFVDFATGRGPSPRFAADVGLFVDGVRTGTLSGAEAAHGNWGAGSALGILSRATEQVVRVGDSYRSPWLKVLTGTPPDAWCGVGRPEAVGAREALTLTVEFDDVDPQPGCPAKVALYETRGAIDTVVAWSGDTGASMSSPIPDVVGLSLTEARERVTAAGYPVQVERTEACHPRDGVVEQAPTQQAVEEDRADDPGWYGPVRLVVEVPHTARDCAALDAAATGFIRFARGGPPPVWAPEVRQLLGHAPWSTVTAARADDRDAWSFCSGVSPEDCALSPLVVAAAGKVATGESMDVSRWPEDEHCELIDRGGLPGDLSDDQLIVLYPARLATCGDDWAVSLWIDDAGRIAALNLLVPEPDGPDGR